MGKASVEKESLWLMDDTIPYDPELIEGIEIPPELQAKLDAIFNDEPLPTGTLSAA